MYKTFSNRTNKIIELPEPCDPEFLYRPKTEFKDTLYNDIAIDI